MSIDLKNLGREGQPNKHKESKRKHFKKKDNHMLTRNLSPIKIDSYIQNLVL